MQTLKSKLDNSINFVYPNGQEARFVHRPDTDYYICYLSTHNGCNQACRFCHLTQTGQTDIVPATLEDLKLQALDVWGHAENYHRYFKKVHFNFMARGEPLLYNSILVTEPNSVIPSLMKRIPLNAEEVKFKISTIFPKGFLPRSAYDYQEFEIYWSLYSLDLDWRKRWIPNAEEPGNVLPWIQEWQELSGKQLVIHGAWIEDENDAQYKQIEQFLKDNEINYRFNLVRYNPYSSAQGKESSKIVTIAKETKAKIIPRVGFDVMASCGMFVGKNDIITR